MKKKEPVNLHHSIHSRLRNWSRENNLDHNFVMNRYACERLLYRLSISEYADQFILKGAMLFSIWSGETFRPTKDIDLLGFGEDSEERLRKIFQQVCSIKPKQPDGITFDAEKITIEQIREPQKYQGKRIFVPVTNARIKVQIDVAFGDVITPCAVEIDYPSLLDMPSARLKAYNRETIIAEKLEAVVSLGIRNSRMKDYYDLLTMSVKYDFDGSLLRDAIASTFNRRKTELPSGIPDGLNSEQILTQSKKTQWDAFLKRSDLDTNVEFEKALSRICDFLIPPLNAAASKEAFIKRWLAGGPWN
jgi:predicted nucleotidyltransferase component of viral defense system